MAINSKGKYKGKEDHYHDLGKELFMNIPSFLESPIMVFQPRDKNDKIIEDNIVAVINAIDKKKNAIIVPIKINGKGRQNFVEIDANILKSAYGRNNLKNYIENKVKAEDMLAIQNKIIRKLKNLK